MLVEPLRQAASCRSEQVDGGLAKRTHVSVSVSGLPLTSEAFWVKNWVSAGLMTLLCSAFCGGPSK